MRFNPTCPASLDTLKVSVPPAVKLAAASANLDIFWLKDESLEDSANLPDPGVLALKITEDLQAALAQFAAIANDLNK
jgi:type I restriction enzyme M protein